MATNKKSQMANLLQQTLNNNKPKSDLETTIDAFHSVESQSKETRQNIARSKSMDKIPDDTMRFCVLAKKTHVKKMKLISAMDDVSLKQIVGDALEMYFSKYKGRANLSDIDNMK